MRKIVTTTAGCVLALSALTACGSGSDGPDSDCEPAHPDLKTVTNGALTVSTYNFPPFVMLDGTEMSGVEGDILNEIAEMECLNLTVQPLDTGSVIPAAQNRRTDLAAGDWYCTKDRSEVLTLAGPVYGDQIAIISDDGASTFEALQGRTVGTVEGYLWNDELQVIYGSNLKVYPTPAAEYADLQSGRLDAAIDSFGSASYANEQNGGSWKIELAEADPRVGSSNDPGQVCFPMANGNESLLTAINENIISLRESGRLAEIMEENGLDPSAADPGPLNLIG